MSKNLLSGRWRATGLFLVAGIAALAVGGASYGWASAGYLAPVVVVIALTLVLMGDRDTDAGAAVRHEADERQEIQRLRIQALVGRVLSLAVAAAYLVAVAARTTLWPFAVLLAVMAASFAIGWWRHGERGSDDGSTRSSLRRGLRR